MGFSLLSAFRMTKLLILGLLMSLSLSMAEVGTEVYNGTPAQPHQFPWMVYIVPYYQNGYSGCGASLISDQWVVTAAHCVQGNPYKVIVELGQHDRTTQAMTKYVSNIIIHKNYNSKTLNNDIALLKLKTPVSFNQYVRPICLASNGAGSFTNSRATVAGWGSTEYSSSSHVLLETEVKVISNDQCRRYPYYGGVGNSMLCTKPDNHGAYAKGSCKGDSGGPLMVEDGKGSFTLVGIVSWGVLRCTTQTRPGVFARVTNFEDWIKTNTRGSNICVS